MISKSFRKRFFAVAAGTLLFATYGFASLDRGAIQGTVTDPQGSVVPGAAVVVRNVDRNTEVKLTTNSAGFFLAPELVPGKYSVRVTAPGFAATQTANVAVVAGDTTTVDTQLRVGSTSQQIQVSAAAPLVEAAPSNFTTDIQQSYIQSIPLDGRDIQGLVQLIPGITQSTGPSGALFGFNSQFGGFPDPLHLVGSGISANGSQGGANAWYLDGSLNAALGAENVVVNPSPDAVAEFNLVDNGLAAEWGRTSGAVVNVVLKSGTNQVHGDLYEFNRNSYFNATNPFSRRDASGRPFLEPGVNFNNFGGTLGGPVDVPHVYNGKNRTFFFVSWDVSMLHENRPTILTVPLPREKQGDFTGDPRFAAVCGVNGATNCLYNPYTTSGPDQNGQFHRTAFSTPVIPSNLIDPLAQFYLSSYPNPNFVDPLQQGPSGCGITCNNFLGPVGSSQTTHNLSVKIDHNIGERHKLFAEWLFNPSYCANYRYPWNGPTAQTQTGIAGAQPYRTINQIFTLGLTSALSPTLVNEARVMFSRQNQIATPNPDSVVDNSDVLKRVQGLNFVLYPPFQVVPGIGIGDIGGFGPQQWQNAIQGVQAYTFTDNVTKILGRHTLKGGLMFRRDNNWNLAAWGYNLGFGGGLTSDPVTGQGGSGLAQFLLGAVDTGSGTGTYHAPYQTNDYWGFYGQDDFRVTPSFTLNIGLRYDIFGWFRERYNDLANFNFSGTNPQIAYPGRIDYFATPRHPSSTVFPAHKGDFAPRLAFSWSPWSNHKTVIRGGFGLIYSNGISVAFGTQNGGISAPGFAQYVPYNGDFTGRRPAFQLSGGAPNLTLPPLDSLKKSDAQFLGSGAGGGFLNGSKDPYVEQWSLFIERELPGAMALSVGYVGTHGLHLYGDEYRNYDYVPTAVREKLRNLINSPVPTDPAIGALYGCGTQCPAWITMRPYPQYTGVPINTNPDGFNRYNSFQLKLEKRYSHGVNFLIAYTIQKNLQSPNTGSLLGNSAVPTTLGRSVGRTSFVPGADSGAARIDAVADDPDNRFRYTALAPDDIPQILNFAVSYDLPLGRGRAFLGGNEWASRVMGGWKLVQNWNLQSGVPLVFSGPCNGLSCRPNLIGDPSQGRNSKTRAQQENQWFNPSAFGPVFGSDPTVIQEVSTGLNPDGTPFDYNAFDPWWTFGNIGLRPPTGRAPGFWNADMTLAKDFHVNESKYFQFRWELFNAFNHQNLGIPNTNWCLPPNPDGSTDAVHVFGCQFGKITNVQTDPRSMEFGLKFYW
ncbi:MAG TPA: TonB-dependent receptor [Terriglobia bacterium]|nr:TonB-dependent receptor [Terriglobia bacterium]